MRYTKLLSALLMGALFCTTSATQLQAYSDDSYYYEDEDFSQDLDLDAVASLFGKSRDLADFEWRLNNPNNQISNLDLNNNGRVDYLRVIEKVRENVRLIIIQDILGPDLYQDVATIEVYRDRYYNRTSVQIVGDPYIYGDNYIINPSYIYTPVIFNYFWSNRHYRPYYSHYRWGYYPRNYRAWRPRSAYYYNQHIHRHIDRRNRYTRKHARKDYRTSRIYRDARRDDFARKHPNRSYKHIQQKRAQTKPHRKPNYGSITKHPKSSPRAYVNSPKSNPMRTNNVRPSTKRQNIQADIRARQQMQQQRGTTGGSNFRKSLNSRQTAQRDSLHRSASQRTTRQLNVRQSTQKRAPQQQRAPRATAQKTGTDAKTPKERFMERMGR